VLKCGNGGLYSPAINHLINPNSQNPKIMNKPEWKHIVKSNSESWHIISGKIGIFVSKTKPSNQWVMRCHHLEIHGYGITLNATNPDDAKTESIEIVKQKILELNNHLDGLIN
jgi:hypothetical protein